MVSHMTLQRMMTPLTFWKYMMTRTPPPMDPDNNTPVEEDVGPSPGVPAIIGYGDGNDAEAIPQKCTMTQRTPIIFSQAMLHLQECTSPTSPEHRTPKSHPWSPTPTTIQEGPRMQEWENTMKHLIRIPYNKQQLTQPSFLMLIGPHLRQSSPRELAAPGEKYLLRSPIQPRRHRRPSVQQYQLHGRRKH